METGLNVFQVIQNELLSRENTRSTVGLGFRLSIIEERVKNAEACARNGQLWRLHHCVKEVTALTPAAKRRMEQHRNRLLNRRDANKHRDDKDPTMMPRDEEVWEVHQHFPHSVLDFKRLQFHPDRIRSLLEFYTVKVLRPDLRPVDIRPDNHCHDIQANLEVCMEELAISWGLNWHRIGGLAMPNPNGDTGHQSHYSPASSHPPSSFNV